ncbi:MAG: glycosyl hydrolase [Planctomycetaceae bacterium]|nr:MAG: glycosyl hydrolase [Planctomycetaceae bacterium]
MVLIFCFLLGCLGMCMGCQPAPPDGPAVESVTQTVTVAEVAPASSSPSASPTPLANLELKHNQLSAGEVEEGWIRLFDGQTLFGWMANSATAWQVDRELEALVAEGEPRGLLLTTCRWADYELRVDVHLEAGGNSGLFLRTPRLPTNPAVDCYELNVCDHHPTHPTGSLVGRARTEDTLMVEGQWHTFHVMLSGPRVVVHLDGRQVLDYVDTSPQPLLAGYIGLQMNGGRVAFRNIFLKPLGGQSLFDGESLHGWRIVPGSQARFTVEGGALRVRGGRGYLETEAVYDNFVLQFSACTFTEHGNTGLFFRAETGTEQEPANGYEFQIEHRVLDGDPQRPADFGTGGIFRRAPARRVLSSNRRWFTAVLVADGPRLRTWVDGWPIVDWVDERPDDPNPRRGRRLSAGHFSVQGHDPHTDAAFRGLRWSPLPPSTVP